MDIHRTCEKEAVPLAFPVQISVNYSELKPGLIMDGHECLLRGRWPIKLLLFLVVCVCVYVVVNSKAN